MRPGDAVAPDLATPALAVEGLGVPFGAGAGLADVRFTLPPGGRLAVVGPSGVGKTTLLRAMAGLASVTAGRVIVRGVDVTALPPERRDVVYLHQTPVLFEHLSVGENVAFPLRVRRVPEPSARERVGAALAAVRLPGLERRAPHTLSGGQRHRVALARALAARPAVLLLDEPLSALDPALRDDVRGAIADVHADRGPAMVLVTHDLDDAGLLADEVAVLLDGRIAQLAPPAALFARPASLAVARLLGVYQTVPGRVRSDGAVECALGVLPGGGAVHPGAPVVLAFRRDALCVAPLDDAPLGIRARVVGMRHRAQGTTLELRLDDAADAPLLEAAVSPRQPFEIGAPCAVMLDPRLALVFPI